MTGDTRFDDIRSHFLKFAGFWVGQVWVVSLSTVILNSPAVSDPARGGDNPSLGTGCDIAGLVIFAIGLAVESMADIQKVACSIVVWDPARTPNWCGV
ncbi:hypothetical protein QFC20_001300 [Naganishia adeliensis]|uniref:Uncharacterized protein n=1 Tax=Naganishia adeliensis TaxID=92952 RepID=A0ACC2WVT1_9TREE|nr:hypothetical protein QFC20_001300 [Naganishia adeliensis]